MFDVYNNIREMAFAFENNRMVYANEAAQYYFNTYVYLLMGNELETFFEWESVSYITKKLELKENFKSSLKLCGGRELDFSARHMKDGYGREYVLFVQKNGKEDIAENIARVASPRSLYDPLMMGKGDMYINELTRLAQQALCSVSSLKGSAVIQRNNSLFDEVLKLSDNINALLNRATYIVKEITSPESRFVITKSVFSLNEMLETISRRVTEYIKLENLNIKFQYTSRTQSTMISGNYHTLIKAVTGLIHIAIKYVLASGRNGRIGIGLKEKDSNAVIEISDNGIGLSKETFSYINEGETDISTLGAQNKKEFLNLQRISDDIKLHNGMLFLENTKEKGSLSTIILPHISKTYSVMRQDSALYGIEDELDSILRNGLI